MRTTFVMDPPPIVEDWLAERRALGQDRFDEVWEGEYRVAPEASNRHAKVQGQLIELLGPRARRAGLLIGGPINIGRPMDFRVPGHQHDRAGRRDRLATLTSHKATRYRMAYPSSAATRWTGNRRPGCVSGRWTVGCRGTE